MYQYNSNKNTYIIHLVGISLNNINICRLVVKVIILCRKPFTVEIWNQP